jgi:lysophosphatidic acid acyltransferase/lysophosphatidylinositol acyltransferase
VIGWSFHFAELIFLERDWERDQLILADSLDNLMLYEQYINLLLFAEGTRFTPAKYEAGVRFAEERNLQVLKHHLIPRTRGFRFTVRHMRKFIGAVYNIQIEFAENSDATVSGVLEGEPLHGHLFVERIPIESIPTDSEQAIDDFLFALYKRKDELSEHFRTKGTFPSVEKVTPKARLAPLINLVSWTLVSIVAQLFFVYLLFKWQLYSCLITGTVIGLIGGTVMLIMMLRSTRTQKGSSYGISKSSKSSAHSSQSELCSN